MASTEAELKAAAKKAYEAGDVATAKKLIARAKAAASGGAASPSTDSPEYAQNGAPANSAAKADLVMRAKIGDLEVSPWRQQAQDAIDTQGPAIAESDRYGGVGSMSKTESALTGFGNMATFGFGDNIVAGLRAPFTDKTYGEELDTMRGMIDRAREENPKSNFAGGLVGAIGASGPSMGRAAVGIASRFPVSWVGRVGGGTIAGLVTGAAEGALTGAGLGDDNPGPGAARGAALGGVMGAGIGAVAPLAHSAVKNVIEWAKGRDVGVISRALGISKDAARVVKSAVESDDIAKARLALRRTGADAMLADAGPATSQLLDTAMVSGSGAARVGRDAVEARSAQAAGRLGRLMDTFLGVPEGVRSAARDIAKRTAPARQAAYDKAYAQPIDYAASSGRRIEDTLSRIPSRTIKAAVDEANDAMRAAGVTNRQILADIAEDGSVTFREMPNVQQLDEIKKALGTIGREMVDTFGRPTAAGRRAKTLAKQLRDAISDAVPSYRGAVKLGGDKLEEDAALDLGRRLLRPGVTREDVAEAMSGASREALAAARRGLRSYVDDTMANVKRVISDGNIDAREAMTALKALSGRANETKVSAILGAQRAKTFFRGLDEAVAHLELRAAVAINSKTAGRLATDRTVDGIVEGGVVGSAMRGEPIVSVKKLTQLLTGSTPADMVAKKQSIMTEIARALTGVRGADAQRVLAQIEKAIAGQPLTTEAAKEIADYVTGSASLLGYQAGRRLVDTSQQATR